MSRGWYLHNSSPDYICISADRRVACGLPPLPPIYDISADSARISYNDFGELTKGKRVKKYRDPIVNMGGDGSIIKSYYNTPELEEDGYDYKLVKSSIHKKHRNKGQWWLYLSQYEAMTGLQRLMYMRF